MFVVTVVIATQTTNISIRDLEPELVKVGRVG
jgi:hypothetical protein